jgi:hypothetical protein
MKDSLAKDLEVWTWVQTALLIVVFWAAIPDCPWYDSLGLSLAALYLTRLLTIANRQEARWAVRRAVRNATRPSGPVGMN